MNAHISDELPRLLTGEASRTDVLDAAAHLRECPDCQQDLVSAVVAHASLSSAHRFAPDVLHDQRRAPAIRDDDAAREQSDVSLPDLSALFARVKAEAPGASRRSPRVLLGVAAAVVVLASAGIGTYAAVHGGTASHRQPVALAPFGIGTTSASASIDGGRVSLDAASLPAQAGKRYEVWLTNAQRTQMQPIGWIGADGMASLTVPTDLLDRFSDIEVSVQPVASPGYQYSNVSVLRGAYRE